MTCVRCEALQKANADLIEELAAWKGWRRGEEAEGDHLTRVERWRRHLHLTPTQAAMVMAMADHPGRVMTHAQLIAASRSAKSGLRDAEEIETRLSGVLICQIRAALKGRIERPIETAWGTGYLVLPDAAAILRRMAGDVQ